MGDYQSGMRKRLEKLFWSLSLLPADWRRHPKVGLPCLRPRRPMAIEISLRDLNIALTSGSRRYPLACLLANLGAEVRSAARPMATSLPTSAQPVCLSPCAQARRDRGNTSPPSHAHALPAPERARPEPSACRVAQLHHAPASDADRVAPALAAYVGLAELL